MKKKKSLGRGLWALIHRDSSAVSDKGERARGSREGDNKDLKDPKETTKRGREHALRTYRKILKKCVTEEGVGEMYEEILKELREHFNITEEEHQMILKSVLGKAIPAPPAGEKEKKVIVVEKPSKAPEEKAEEIRDKEDSKTSKGAGKTEDAPEIQKKKEPERASLKTREEDTLGKEEENVEEGGTEEVMVVEHESLPSGDEEEVHAPFGSNFEALEEPAGGGEEETITVEEEYEEVDPEGVIEEAEKLFEEGDRRGALSLLNDTLSKFESAELYNELGLILYRMGEYTASEGAFERAVELGGEDPTPLINLAMLQAEEGKFEEALRNMRGALRRDPTNEHILNNLAYICGKMGLYQEAQEYLDELLQLNPKSVEGWFNRGVIYEKMREFEKAYMAYDKVLSLDPSNKTAKMAREELFGKLR